MKSFHHRSFPVKFKFSAFAPKASFKFLVVKLPHLITLCCGGSRHIYDHGTVQVERPTYLAYRNMLNFMFWGTFEFFANILWGSAVFRSDFLPDLCHLSLLYFSNKRNLKHPSEVLLIKWGKLSTQYVVIRRCTLQRSQCITLLTHYSNNLLYHTF